jgi:hypothetical protein
LPDGALARKYLGIEAKIYGFFFAAFAGVVILGLVTYNSTRNLMATDRSVAHALEVRDSLDELKGWPKNALF